MELNELKQKFDDIKSRLAVVEKANTVAETQKKAIVERLEKEFNIKPEELKETIEKMKIDIVKKKDDLQKEIACFEALLIKVEKTINE